MASDNLQFGLGTVESRRLNLRLSQIRANHDKQRIIQELPSTQELPSPQPIKSRTFPSILVHIKRFFYSFKQDKFNFSFTPISIEGDEWVQISRPSDSIISRHCSRHRSSGLPYGFNTSNEQVERLLQQAADEATASIVLPQVPISSL